MASTLPRYSPLNENHDLNDASAKQLREQLRYELKRVKDETGHGIEGLALELGFKSGASVSRWLNGHDPVSGTAAKELDRLGHVPSVGGSFEVLQKAYIRAGINRGSRQVKPPRTYDVFLASPMASLKGKRAYETERKAARDLRETIENFLGLSVYYAGETLESQDEFDSPLAAAEQNFDALHSARYFVLLSVSKAVRPSSVTVEAGYALACRIPSLYLVRDVEHLPFVLRSLAAHESPELPPVSIEVVNSGARAVGLIRKAGGGILSRLDDQIQPSKRRTARRKGKA